MTDHLLGNKRKREEDTNEKETEEESIINNICFKAIEEGNMTCKECKSKLENTIQFMCFKSDDINNYYFMCIKCLLSKISSNELKDIEYKIVDKMNFPLFTENWTFKDEIILLHCIQKYGFENWDSLTELFDNKGLLEFKSHYYSFYYKNKTDTLPSEDDVCLKDIDYTYKHKNEAVNDNNENNKDDVSINKMNIDRFQENIVNNNINISNDNQNIWKIYEGNRICIDQSILERNTKKVDKLRSKYSEEKLIYPEQIQYENQKNNIGRNRNLSRNTGHRRNQLIGINQNTPINSGADILKYSEKRDEFEMEFLGDAEIEIAELEFIENESEEDIKIKENMLLAYKKELEEREKRRKFIISKGLLDLKRQNGIECKLSREDREILNFLKPTLKFFDQSKFYDLFECERIEKDLKQIINQLKGYQKMGLNTLDAIKNNIEPDIHENKHIQNCTKNGLGDRMKMFFEFQNIENPFNYDEHNFIKDFPLAASKFYNILQTIKNKFKYDIHNFNDQDYELFNKTYTSIDKVYEDLLNEINKYDIEKISAEQISDFFKKQFLNNNFYRNLNQKKIDEQNLLILSNK